MAREQDDAWPRSVQNLAEQVARDGGQVLAAYREPVGDHWHLFCLLPAAKVAPTPYQRDLSPTHAKRLQAVVRRIGRFVDPVVVVSPEPGVYWTPNGNHRRAVAEKLKLRTLPAILIPEAEVAFEILALNTEKAHNLRDRSLEVIRMARQLAGRNPRARESSFAAEFEAPEFLTLGIVYLQEKRFAGGAYRPFLKKVETFSEQSLAVSLRKREDLASRLIEIDGEVKRIITLLGKRGFRSPYLRGFVVARINPVRFHRARKGDAAPPMTLGAALIRMAAAARKFDAGSVKFSDLALVAAVAATED
jgi:ParB family chromosome partitioning protein